MRTLLAESQVVTTAWYHCVVHVTTLCHCPDPFDPKHHGILGSTFAVIAGCIFASDANDRLMRIFLDALVTTHLSTISQMVNFLRNAITLMRSGSGQPEDTPLIAFVKQSVDAWERDAEVH